MAPSSYGRLATREAQLRNTHLEVLDWRTRAHKTERDLASALEQIELNEESQRDAVHSMVGMSIVTVTIVLMSFGAAIGLVERAGDAEVQDLDAPRRVQKEEN